MTIKKQEERISLRRWALILGLLLMLAAAAVAALLHWYSSQQDRLRADGRVETAKAREYARTHDQNACVDEALRREDACKGITDLLCETRAIAFIRACLEAAAKTPHFCDDVPKWKETTSVTAWSSSECRRRHRMDVNRCGALLVEIPFACAPSTTGIP
jgi:hypothetical protein